VQVHVGQPQPDRVAAWQRWLPRSHFDCVLTLDCNNCLEDPPGLSPITTIGRYPTVEEAQVAADEVWASR
jgi:hypothetical protein